MQALGFKYGYQTPASCWFFVAVLIYVTLVANLSGLISMLGPSLNLEPMRGRCEIRKVAFCQFCSSRREFMKMQLLAMGVVVMILDCHPCCHCDKSWVLMAMLLTKTGDDGY